MNDNSLCPNWVALPDPRRLELPYRRGLCLSIRRHTPPPPFGSWYFNPAKRQLGTNRQMEGVPQSEWCLQQPPADTGTHADPTVRRLRILDQLACKDGRGPQVVRCHLDQDESRVYVAKIYDALYYAFGVNAPIDVTWYADFHYSREAAAYEDLEEAGVDGCYAPKYFGSWTFDMTLLDQAQTVRPVRMVLMEWIDGVSLQSLIDGGRVRDFSPEQRLNILAAAFEVETKMNFYGVRHNDFAPRNVILERPDADKDGPRVRLVDFNVAIAKSWSLYHTQNAELPTSPMCMHWHASLPEFQFWTPEPHRSRLPVFKGWLKARWEHSTEFTLRPEWMVQGRVNFDEPVEMVEPFPDEDVKPARRHKPA